MNLGTFLTRFGAKPWFFPSVLGSSTVHKDSYLVDAASSHMLVSKIKPCMCKYSPSMVKPRMAH